MDKSPVPYKRIVFVCVNSRADGSPSCGNPGQDGPAVLQALKAGVKERGLKGKVRVTRTGCLDLCARGPVVMVYPEGDCYTSVKAADAPALLEKIAA